MVLEHPGLSQFANPGLQQLYAAAAANAAAAAAAAATRHPRMPSWAPFLHQFGMPAGMFGGPAFVTRPRFDRFVQPVAAAVGNAVPPPIVAGSSADGQDCNTVVAAAAAAATATATAPAVTPTTTTNLVAPFRVLSAHQLCVGANNRILPGPASADSIDDPGNHILLHADTHTYTLIMQ